MRPQFLQIRTQSFVFTGLFVACFLLRGTTIMDGLRDGLREKSGVSAAAWIVLASVLWATDFVVRVPATSNFPSSLIVLSESLVGLLVLLPFVLYRYGLRAILRLNSREFVAVLILGFAGSVVGHLAFTMSVKSIGPSTATAFEMLQPAFVIALSALFLKERHTWFYFPVAIWVAVNATLICLGEMGLAADLPTGGLIRGMLLALGASFLWGVSTVVGKALLERHSPAIVALWRWSAAAVGLFAVVLFREGTVDFSPLLESATLPGLAYLGIFAGVIPMILYYRGLQQLPASVASFIELLYPLLGVFLPILHGGASLSFFQVLGGLSLLGAVLLVLSYRTMTADQLDPSPQTLKDDVLEIPGR